MKNHPFSYRILLFVLALFITSAMFAQSTELNYKAKGRTFMTAKIYFSNQNGGEEITPEVFFDYENIFFTIIPATPDGKNYFKESEISEDLSLIKLKQGFTEIQPQAALKPVLNGEGKIDKVIMSFAKRQVKLFVPFSFVSPVDTAIISNLSDEYYKYYNKYSEKYVYGLDLVDEKLYIDAFYVLMEIVEERK